MSVVASVLFEHRLPQHAREAAHTALAIYPLVEIHNMTGRQAYMTGDYTRALADWKQALGLAEETDAEAAARAEIRWRIGTVAMEKVNNSATAIAHFERAIERDPDRFNPLSEKIQSMRSRPIMKAAD